MLGAAETPYDLRFRFLGVPVRIHPIFWLVSVVMGWQDRNLPAGGAVGRVRVRFDPGP